MDHKGNLDFSSFAEAVFYDTALIRNPHPIQQGKYNSQYLSKVFGRRIGGITPQFVLGKIRRTSIMKTMKTCGLVLTLVMAIGFLAFADPAPAQDEFKYGSIMPVTGPIPQYGEYFNRGSQVALEDLEKSGWIGGKKIRIILEDGKADPKISLAAMNKLVNIDKVPIVESLVTPVMLAIGPIAHENSVVLVNTAAQSVPLRKLGPFFFSVNPLADAVMALTVKYAAKGLKAKKIAIMHVNNDYGRSVADTFKQIFEKEYGGKIVATEIINMGETDFTTHLTKIKFVKADIIFTVAHEAELGYALKKAKQIGLKTPFLSGPGMTGPMTMEIAGDAIEGLKAPDYLFDPINGSDRMKAFGKRYKEKFNVMPYCFPAFTYDSIMLYATALKSGARTGVEVRDYYRTLKDWVGVSGPVAFDKDGITTTGSVIREFRKGVFVDVKWKQ
jgi:branched-chain amino acid transport system substrate-binding protein